MASRPPNRLETTPSGIEVAYWASFGVDGKPQRRRYAIGGPDGEVVPSVSTIAGVFEKPALVPAAVKLQEEGVIALAKAGVDIPNLTQPELRARLRDAGLHYDSVWAESRGRGDVVHDVLLELTRGREVDFSAYPDHAQPWLRAAQLFVADERPEVIDTEYIVASPIHKFAGRGDLYCRLPDGTRVRIDYKTVSEWKTDQRGIRRPPYDENLIALAGYELAAYESGYGPSELRWIVRLGPDGDYDITQSHAHEEVFLAALTAHRERKNLVGGRA